MTECKNKEGLLQRNSQQMKSWLPQPEGKHSGVFLQAELHHLSTEAGESSKKRQRHHVALWSETQSHRNITAETEKWKQAIFRSKQNVFHQNKRIPLTKSEKKMNITRCKAQ
uniref:PPUP8428 n=1 Tax=Poeciliopsis prolifica TaxID=188132 RepID=A0A0S7ER07_9TELE